MTRYLLDIASYQGDLNPADVKRAGFTAVNLKVSHGLTTSAVHPNLTGWVAAARALGLGISTFHYFTAGATGEAQAAYAHERLHALGLLTGTAHQLDVESNPPPGLSSVRSYLTTMTALLQRPIALYTGDWWWTARPGWDVSDLTPYLWSAPNRGYLASYPGDDSAHWLAGYGGWPSLSVMQYAVAPLSFPDGSNGTIAVSKSAIRDESVWRTLTGDDVATSQNGWPVDTTGAHQDRDPIYGNVKVPNGVLEGDVATVFRWVAERYHKTVEPLVAGTCWGWFVKTIIGSATISNHASGTAIDLNADQHALGTKASASMTDRQIDACHAIVTAADGVIRWGGDYTGRPDPMHWEIVGTKSETAAFARKIRSEGDDMPITNADVDTILNRDAIPNLYGDASNNPTITVRTALKAAESADIRTAGILAAMTASAAAEVRRDAEQSARLEQLIALVQLLGNADGALTPEQFSELKQAMTDAATAAGDAAAERIEGKLDSLREHLGDDGPVA